MYENSLEKLNELSEKDIEFGNTYGTHKFDSKDILIFPIILHGQSTDGFHLFRDKESDKKNDAKSKTKNKNEKDKKGEKKESLAKTDYHLYEALNLLKGLHLLSSR